MKPCTYPKCVYDKKSKSCSYPTPFSVALTYYSDLKLSKKTVTELYHLNKKKFTDIKSACRIMEGRQKNPSCSVRELGVLSLADQLVLGTRKKELTPGEILYSIDLARKLFSPYNYHIHVIPFCFTNNMISYQQQHLYVCVNKIQELYKNMSVSKHLFLAYIGVVTLIFYALHSGDELTELTYNLSEQDTHCLSQTFRRIKNAVLVSVSSTSSSSSSSSNSSSSSSSSSL